jgi:methylenetetrahydrofolate--tRNA-(uracil-5-)-methyltransferase
MGYYVSHADPQHYDPTNITFGIMPPLDPPVKSKHERQLATSERALRALASWIAETSLAGTLS